MGEVVFSLSFFCSRWCVFAALCARDGVFSRRCVLAMVCFHGVVCSRWCVFTALCARDCVLSRRCVLVMMCAPSWFVCTVWRLVVCGVNFCVFVCYERCVFIVLFVL